LNIFAGVVFVYYLKLLMLVPYMKSYMNSTPPTNLSG